MHLLQADLVSADQVEGLPLLAVQRLLDKVITFKRYLRWDECEESRVPYNFVKSLSARECSIEMGFLLKGHGKT